LPGLPRLDVVRDAVSVAEARTGAVVEVRHPLVQHKLAYLRDKNTPTVHFRKLVNEVTLLLTYEATKDMPTEDVEVETPPESVRLIAIIAAPEGIERIHRDHPEVQIVVAAIDRGLNERGFIVPGLGDAGDRLYGTK